MKSAQCPSGRAAAAGTGDIDQFVRKNHHRRARNVLQESALVCSTEATQEQTPSASGTARQLNSGGILTGYIRRGIETAKIVPEIVKSSEEFDLCKERYFIPFPLRSACRCCSKSGSRYNGDSRSWTTCPHDPNQGSVFYRQTLVRPQPGSDWRFVGFLRVALLLVHGA